MRLINKFMLVLILGVSIAGCTPEPVTDKALDSAISSLNQRIKEAKADAIQYSGGLLKVQIELRQSILQTTKAMLEQKRESLLRMISLNYTVNGAKAVPATKDELATIEQDLISAREKASKANAEANKYSGGLIKAMALSAAATASVTEAMLEQHYYARKYGISAMMNGLNSLERKKPTVPEDELTTEEAL